MTYVGSHCMAPDRQTLQGRLALFVRRYSAKQLAILVGCDERTAENMRKGYWPIARHWAGLIAAFGRDITEAVFHPDAAAARLAEEIAQLESQLAERRSALGVVGQEDRSFAARHARAAAATDGP